MEIPTIVFIIGMHRCGTSLLSSCLVENNFSIGTNINKDKDLFNPNGYYENDSFTEFHEELLKYNNCSWYSINKKMNYTKTHVKDYIRLILKEFKSSKLILIKDPRLTFFIDFLEEVCNKDYNTYFLFLSRNKLEVCRSICFAQKITVEEANKLYDITHENYSNKFLKIDYKDIIDNHSNTINIISSYCNFSVVKDTSNIVDFSLYRNRKSV